MNPDVAIIGTGPGGGVAACTLAQSGLRVRLLEAKTLPRAKPCGGLMPSGVASLLNWDLEDLISHKVNTLEYFHNYRNRHINSLSRGQLLLVDRGKFDLGLTEQAILRSSGSVELHQNCSLRQIEEHTSDVSISGEGFAPFKARFVIGADGVASRTARCLGLNSERRSGVTLDAELEVSDACYDRFCDRVIFNYYCLPQGYGWIFPKQRPVLSCGVGSWGKSGKIRESMRQFIALNFTESEIVSETLLGFPIPIYSGEASIASQRVCLVGDAASLVNPVSGEGIRFAMWSGYLAAQSILELIEQEEAGQTNSSGCRIYQDKVYRETARSLDHSLRFAALPFLQAPDLYYQKFIRDCSGNPHYT